MKHPCCINHGCLGGRYGFESLSNALDFFWVRAQENIIARIGKIPVNAIEDNTRKQHFDQIKIAPSIEISNSNEPLANEVLNKFIDNS